MESRVRWVDLWPDTKQAHQGIAVIAGKMLRGVAIVQAFESKGDELELTQDQISLVMVDELRELVVR